MRLNAAVGTSTSTYQISWQAHSALDVWQAELRQQQRDVWRPVFAGQAGGCTVSVLARRTASKASAAFQACQRGLRVLQMQGKLSGAYFAVNSTCMTMTTGSTTLTLGCRCQRDCAAAHWFASVEVLSRGWPACVHKPGCACAAALRSSRV